MSDAVNVSSWPSRVKVILPSRAFLLSWREQTVPARRHALADAAEHFASLAAGGDAALRDMALLAVIAEAMQPLEDLAYLATAWDEPFGGLAKYVKATVYSARTPSSFWQRIHKRDDDYFDVLAGFSARDPETGLAVDTLEGLGGTAALTAAQLDALSHARAATRRRLRLLLGILAQDWARFGNYFYAYKHGGLAANRDDVTWVDDDSAPITDDTPAREPSIAVWHRAGKRFEGRGEFHLTPPRIVRDASGLGRLAIELTEAFIESRLSVFDAVELNDDGSVRALQSMQLPWTIWLREADLPPEMWATIGRGPRITWTEALSDGEALVVDG